MFVRCKKCSVSVSVSISDIERHDNFECEYNKSQLLRNPNPNPNPNLNSSDSSGSSSSSSGSNSSSSNNNNKRISSSSSSSSSVNNNINNKSSSSSSGNIAGGMIYQSRFISQKDTNISRTCSTASTASSASSANAVGTDADANPIGKFSNFQKINNNDDIFKYSDLRVDVKKAVSKRDEDVFKRNWLTNWYMFNMGQTRPPQRTFEINKLNKTPTTIGINSTVSVITTTTPDSSSQCLEKSSNLEHNK